MQEFGLHKAEKQKKGTSSQVLQNVGINLDNYLAMSLSV